MIPKLLIVSKYDWKTREKKHEEIKQMFLLCPDIEDVQITFRKQDLGKPETYVDGEGKTRISENWFEENISRVAKAQGFTHAGFQFSDADGKKWGIGKGHRGSNFNDGDFFGEFWIKCNEDSKRNYVNGVRQRNTYVTDIPHEVGHEFKRGGFTDLDIHHFDYQSKINNIEEFYRLLEIKQTSYIEHLYQQVIFLMGLKELLEKPVLPIKDFEKVSQHFLEPNTAYKSKVHNGTDWAVILATPIYAPQNGYFSRIFKNHPSMGNCGYFHFKQAGVDYSMRIMHLSKVPVIKTYLKGEVIAYSGNTGNSTGPHVHIDLWKGNVIDPAKIYTKLGVMENLLDPYKFFKGINT